MHLPTAAAVQRSLGCLFGGIALLAAGSSAGWLSLTQELCWYVPSAAAAAHSSIATFALGALAGLWWPRRLIRRRLANAAEDVAPLLSTALAASLTAATLVVLALLWLLQAVLLLEWEQARTWLLTRFFLPEAGRAALVAAPLLLLTALLGMASTTVLIAQLGWYRALHGTGIVVGRAWGTFLVAALLGAIVCCISGTAMGLLLPALLIFVAALLAVAAPNAPALHTSPPPASSLAPREWRVLADLACAGLVGAALLAQAADAAVLTTGSLGIACSAGAAGGLLLARTLMPPRSPLAGGVLSLAAAALLAALPPHSDALLSAARLALVFGLLTLSISGLGRHLARRAGSVQYALALVGSGLASGALLAALLGALLEAAAPRWLQGTNLVAGASLVLIAIRARDVYALNRRDFAIALLGAAAAFGWSVLSATRFFTPSAAASSAAESPAAALAFEQAARDAFHGRLAPAAGFVSAMRGASAVRLDTLAYDVLFLDAAALTSLDDRGVQRGLSRAGAALRPGGRLLIVGPRDGRIEAALRNYAHDAARAAHAADEILHELRCPRRNWRAWIIGRDVKEWLTQMLADAAAQLTLSPLDPM